MLMVLDIRFGPFLRVLEFEFKCPRDHVYERGTHVKK